MRHEQPQARHFVHHRSLRRHKNGAEQNQRDFQETYVDKDRRNFMQCDLQLNTKREILQSFMQLGASRFCII